MTVENDFLVWAPSGGEVMTQANYAANAALTNGITTGLADPTLYNKSQRQASIIATMIADFIVAQSGQPAIDDGTTATLLANFIAALKTIGFPTSLGTLATNTTLTATNAGTYYNINGSSVVVTLNDTTFVAGQTIGFLARTACTINTGGSTLYGGSLSGSSLSMPAGSFVALEWDGTNWRQLAGSFVTGRLLNVQIFTTSSTYTPTAGTTSVIVEALGAGGAGGGAPGVSSGAGYVTLGAPGSAGAYGKGRYTSGFSGATVTVGAGGTAAAAAAGTAGGTSSFGALLTCPGGGGGGIVGPILAPIATGGAGSSAPSGSNIAGGPGSSGNYTIAFSGSAGYCGNGGSTLFGGGGGAVSPDANGLSGTAPGTGGGGTMNTNNNASNLTGGNGAPGIVIVWEYT